MPRFAPESFQRWVARREVSARPSRQRVILWPDTFNNHFEPHTAQAAVEVLEEAGYRVEVPAEPLCCGRPLYDYGMLDEAKRQLLQVLDVLRPSIRAGVPVVMLEPSCGSVFTDELVNLFPNDEDAQRLKQQTFLFADFLEQEGYTPPRLERQAVLHGHCHHKALVGLSAEERLLKKAGLEVNTLDSGCCGMAGSFGFEPEKYELSMKIGERKLLPAVREAPEDTLLVADGFSCRTQIEQGSPRRALHLAEVLRMARREGPRGPSGKNPERAHVQPRPSTFWLSAGAVLLLGLVGWGLRRA
jgi:Fe-S oxidoreductase